MSIESVLMEKRLEKIEVKLNILGEIIRMYLSQREDIGDGEDSFEDLYTAYAEKLWAEIQGET